MNPCHCGYAGVKNKECGKVPECVINYQKKISGPILDRIDLQINMISESNNIADVYQTANKSEFNSKNFRKIVTRVVSFKQKDIKNININ
jgi:magnesium chelatase family protein